ncbi:MAG: serine/threonine-protein kinase [Pseudonocardiales bacterium]
MTAPPEATRSPMPRGYEFVRVLGSGGYGWVALARQSALDRLVAVKTLYSGGYDQAERRRLEREGRALARLRDTRIVAIYAMEEVGDDLALVLEYVDGGDLKGALKDHTLSGPQLLRVLTDTATALDRAAAAGIVHRDVKPGNVLVTRDGRGKLTDFGLARLTASAGEFRTGGPVVIGTPLYMAPEQINDPEHESSAGDAYSFAAMAYQVLLGRPPFKGDALDLFWNHTRVPPPPPRSILPTLSADADAVLQAGLAKHPAHRPTPGQLMAILNTHPEDWTHFVAAPRPGEPPRPASHVPAGATRPTAPPAFAPPDAATSGINLFAGDAPWVEVPVYRPPVIEKKKPFVPPLLVGAVVGVVVVVIVALLLL